MYFFTILIKFLKLFTYSCIYFRKNFMCVKVSLYPSVGESPTCVNVHKDVLQHLVLRVLGDEIYEA